MTQSALATTAVQPNWNDLQLFLALARRLHFGRTAVELGVSQAHVSRRLQVLEQIYGLRLLRRTTRTVELTPEGQRLRTELEEFERRLAGFARGTGPVLAQGRTPAVRSTSGPAVRTS